MKIKKQNILITLFVFIIVYGCNKEEAIKDLEPGIIENKCFSSTVFLDGNEYDGTIIRNCTFENIDGDGLQLRNVERVCIENCIFRNISGNGIRFRNSGVSDGVKIKNNKVYNIKQNGILAPENQINTLIKGNLIYNVATSNTSSQFGAPHHGIYFQGYNVTITENTIYDIINDQGNCISIRTYGTISRNILHNSTDHGISYYSDHPGDSKRLLIENNMIYDNGKRGINMSSDGNSGNHIGSALIRFNTIVSDDESPIRLNDNLTGVTYDIIGNIAIRTDGGSNYIYTNLPYNQSNNITGSGDIGFINFTNRNLHITPSSTAVNAATGTTNFPIIDFDGDTRTSSNLDAGADEL